jgi:tetratricopeptide (TPR) repeat protein
LLEVKVNKLWEAGELYEATLKEYDDFLGPCHNETIRCRLNYATLLEKRGEPTRAQELYRELAAQTELAEKRDPGLLASISWCLMDAENPTQEDRATALQLSGAALERDVADKSSVMDTHARALFENGLVAEAVKTQREVVSQAPHEPAYFERLQRYESALNQRQS